MIRLIIPFFLLLSFGFSETGNQIKSPTTGAFDFTYEDNLSNSIQSFKPETTIDKVLIPISKQNVMTRRENVVFNCHNDSFNNTYCPNALSQCAPQFDYDSGYSIGGVGLVIDYTNKSGQTNYAQPIPQGNTCSNYSVGCGSGAFGWGQPISYPVVDLLSGHSPIKIYQNGVYKGDISSWSEVTSIHNQCDGYGIAWSGNSAGCFSGKCNRGAGFSFCSQEQCSLVAFKTNGGVGCENGCTGYYCANTNNVSCPSGYNTVSMSNGSIGCAQTTYYCPSGYTDVGNGQCSKMQEYTYYTYLCNNIPNSQGFNFVRTSTGGNTGKSDPNTTIINDLTSTLNNSTPPVNNCQRQKFTCQANSNRPCSFVDNSWQCSPFACNEKKECGYGLCPYGTTPSDNLFQDPAYNPIRAINNGTCNGAICDYAMNNKNSYCISKECPIGPEYVSKDGNCYKEECPKGTYMSGSKCISSSY